MWQHLTFYFCRVSSELKENLKPCHIGFLQVPFLHKTTTAAQNIDRHFLGSSVTGNGTCRKTFLKLQMLELSVAGQACVCVCNLISDYLNFKVIEDEEVRKCSAISRGVKLASQT